MFFDQLFSVIAVTATLLEGSMDAALPDKNIDGSIFLVNREHVISKNYIPVIRKTILPGMSQSIQDEAATALEALFAAADEEGIGLETVSGYRSYSTQATIYQRKVESTGSEAAADQYVAKPGTSEHQLGLAMDISREGSSSLVPSFGTTTEGIWVKENAHRFGFIIRYPEEYVDVTGYSYEPWHLRYVGVEHAEAIYESGLPMEWYVSAYRLEVYHYLVQALTEEVLP